MWLQAGSGRAGRQPLTPSITQHLVGTDAAPPPIQPSAHLIHAHILQQGAAPCKGRLVDFQVAGGWGRPRRRRRASRWLWQRLNGAAPQGGAVRHVISRPPEQRGPCAAPLQQRCAWYDGHQDAAQANGQHPHQLGIASRNCRLCSHAWGGPGPHGQESSNCRFGWGGGRRGRRVGECNCRKGGDGAAAVGRDEARRWEPSIATAAAPAAVLRWHRLFCFHSKSNARGVIDWLRLIILLT